MQSALCDQQLRDPACTRDYIKEGTAAFCGQCYANPRPTCRDARHICLREYGDAPEVMIYGAQGLAFPYIPSHLHHIMFELTKNSLRAVADRFEYADAAAPPIRVVISQGEEDITIKVL